MISLGIEGTAEKTGVGIVDSDGNILAMAGKQLFPEEGGIHPRIAAEHHAEWIPKLIPQAIEESGIKYSDIDLISFSQGPGLGPALLIFTGPWPRSRIKNCGNFRKKPGVIIK